MDFQRLFIGPNRECQVRLLVIHQGQSVVTNALGVFDTTVKVRFVPFGYGLKHLLVHRKSGARHLQRVLFQEAVGVIQRHHQYPKRPFPFWPLEHVINDTVGKQRHNHSANNGDAPWVVKHATKGLTGAAHYFRLRRIRRCLGRYLAQDHK